MPFLVNNPMDVRQLQKICAWYILHFYALKLKILFKTKPYVFSLLERVEDGYFAKKRLYFRQKALKQRQKCAKNLEEFCHSVKNFGWKGQNGFCLQGYNEDSSLFKTLALSAVFAASASLASAATATFTTPVTAGGPFIPADVFGVGAEDVMGDQFAPGGARIARDPYEDTALAGVTSYSYLQGGFGAANEAIYNISGTSISLVWGSVDPGTQNVIEFYKNGVLVDSITGDALLSAVPAAPLAELGVEAVISAAQFDSFRFVNSSNNSFEYGGLAVAPIPASVLLMLAGLGGLFGVRARKSA